MYWVKLSIGWVNLAQIASVLDTGNGPVIEYGGEGERYISADDRALLERLLTLHKRGGENAQVEAVGLALAETLGTLAHLLGQAREGVDEGSGTHTAIHEALQGIMQARRTLEAVVHVGPEL